ncbi:MAG: hypothetical protein ACLP51_00690 [Syntrophobacteraceae bacterium]
MLSIPDCLKKVAVRFNRLVKMCGAFGQLLSLCTSSDTTPFKVSSRCVGVPVHSAVPDIRSIIATAVSGNAIRTR